MLEWLFGGKSEAKQQKKSSDQLGKEDIWIYDYVRQYLVSPIWRNPLLDFIEEHCILFEDNQQNKFQYTKIFQQFVGLTALLLQTMIEQIGIPQRTLQKCIIRGMKSQKDAKIFQQILICDNFLAFKKVMLSKNKQLEVQALKKISLQSKHPQNKKAEQQKIQIDIKQLQRLQIQKVIAMSIALNQKILTQQQKQLEQAIRLSQQQYQKQQIKRQQEKKKTVEIKKQQVRSTNKKLSSLSQLPPLISAKPKKTIQQYKLEQQKIKQQIQVLKQKQQQKKLSQLKQAQNAEERKKRLMEQRQIIRKKKQDQRKQQLTTFVQNKQTTQSTLSQEQLNRRRNLMKKLKQQLKE